MIRLLQSYRLCFTFLCFALYLATPVHAQQPDTSRLINIEILNAETLRGSQTPGGPMALIGNVQLKQEDNLMYCDSAYISQAENNVEAFGNVQIVQPGGTEVVSDYLRYTGNKRLAYLRGNVVLTDGKNTLWAEELEYNLATKVGVYTLGGTLQSDLTTLSSNSGNYNSRSKDARFVGDVIVSDPEYNVTSTDLGYNTETKLVTFFGPSIVISDQSELRTSSGTWDAKNEIAHFNSRSSIQNQEQYIEADKLDYNKQTGFGVSVGNVVAIDTANKTTLYCGYAEYNQLTNQLLATIKPVMKQVSETDSIYIRADTFYSEPVAMVRDSADTTKVSDTVRLSGKVTETTQRTITDTARADSSRPRYFIAYHHVLIYSDSMQARCDSLLYSQADSVMKLMSSRLVSEGIMPVAWSRNSQITGDTILLYLDSNKLKRIFIPNNAFVASRSGPEKANMFDQVQGKTLTGYFENNAMREMIVFPQAESIYYSTDEDNAYLGVNQAQSERMRVLFEDQEVSKIILEQEVKQTMTPMQQANISAMRLSRFLWLEEHRPESVQQLFLYDPYADDDAALEPQED